MFKVIEERPITVASRSPNVIGTDEHVREVLAALAIEMATSPWAEHIVITCVGFAKELPGVVGTDRVQYASSMEAALADFAARADEVAAMLADAEVDSARRPRWPMTHGRRTSYFPPPPSVPRNSGVLEV